MVSLEVEFAGLKLRNPVVVASAPPTESVESIVRCADAGAGAVVTKTMADFDEDSFPLGARRAYVDRSGMWALSTFRRETLTRDEGQGLIKEAVRRVDIPVIASVGALTMTPEDWLVSCRAAEEAGASAVQLDLFYSPQPRSSPANVERLVELIAVLTAEISIPLIPKLNTDLPAHHIAGVLEATPVSTVFAIDSMRTPAPLDVRRGGHPLTKFAPNAPETSLFGAWQKPITLQYTRTLAENSTLEIGAGGGFMTGYDAAESMLLGASVVQFGTAIIRNGFSRIGMILEQLSRFMADNGYQSAGQFRGAALQSYATEEKAIDFVDVKAAVDQDLCTMCGLCTTLVFCPDVITKDGSIEILDHCDGCGLCVSVCPTKPKALRLLPVAGPSR